MVVRLQRILRSPKISKTSHKKHNKNPKIYSKQIGKTKTVSSTTVRNKLPIFY